MTEKKPTKKVEALVSDLLSTQPVVVLGALNKIPEQGNASLVLPLLRTHKAWPEEAEIQEKIEKIIGELKTQKAIPELVKALDDKEFDHMRAMILSVFWHAGLFPSDHLDVLIRHAIRGDYMVTVEVMTIFDNTDEELDPDLLQQYILDIDEFLDKNPDAAHFQVLVQLKEVIKEQYNK